MFALLRQLHQVIESGDRAALAMVVGRRGSLPMSERAKMLVTSGGIDGTIGGGCLEAEVYATARRILTESEVAGCSLDRFDLTEVEEGLGGHVCGGTVSVLTQTFIPDAPTRRMASELAAAIDGRRRAVFVSRLPCDPGDDSPDSGPAPAVTAVVVGEGLYATATVPAPVVEAATRLLGEPTAKAEQLTVGDGGWVLEPLLPAPVAMILGAGHCGRAIGELAARVGFRVVVADDRPAFLDRDSMPWADEVQRVDFASALATLQPGAEDHLIIVTRGHEHDLTLLRQALETPAAYVGMIGSERKRLLFERELRAEGVSDEALRRARSPMGLPIAADTPEEIAVAVVAEMIAVRRGAVLPEGLTSGVSSRRRARRAAGNG